MQPKMNRTVSAISVLQSKTNSEAADRGPVVLGMEFLELVGGGTSTPPTGPAVTTLASPNSSDLPKGTW